MKHLVGMCFAIAAMVLLFLAQEYISPFFSDYLIGWLSCTAYFAGHDLYQTKNNNQ